MSWYDDYYYRIMKGRYFDKIIDKEDFGIYKNSQLNELQHEKELMEKSVGFEMPFTTDFYNCHLIRFRDWLDHEVTLRDVSKEMREEIMYFGRLNREKELRKKQEKEQEAITNEKVKNEYNNFLTLQRKRLLWKRFPDHKYNEVLKDFELEEQNITITIPKNE